MRMFLLVTVTLGVALAAPAAAQQTSAQAEAAFRRGKQLMAQNKLAEACASFAASQAIEPMVTTLINLADCREKNKELASAWGHYTEAQRQLRGRKDSDSVHLLKVATKRATRLEPRLSHLTIVAPAGVEVTRNGERVEPASFGQALPVDGGTYELAAHAPGHADWSTTVKLAVQDEARSVTVPELVPLATAPRPVAKAPVSAPPPRAHPAPRPAAPAQAPAHASRLPGYATLGAGALAIGGSLVIGQLARSKYSDAKAVCGGDLECADDDQVQRAKALSSQARTRAWIATGVGAAGLVAVGVGTYLVLRAPSPRERLAIAPSATPDSVGVVAWGAF